MLRMHRKPGNGESWMGVSLQNNLRKNLRVLLRETGTERRRQGDRYRQKLEDVFSGQEPNAKISEDVNS